LLSLTTWIAYLFLGKPRFGIDDAQIILSLWRISLPGQGIGVYNTPAAEHVEGYSSPWWVMAVAAALQISKANPEALSAGGKPAAGAARSLLSGSLLAR